MKPGYMMPPRMGTATFNQLSPNGIQRGFKFEELLIHNRDINDISMSEGVIELIDKLDFCLDQYPPQYSYDLKKLIHNYFCNSIPMVKEYESLKKENKHLREELKNLNILF